MIVCKFGGSSLSSAQQIQKACAIMTEDPRRKIMVVSAAGKRSDVIPDEKITDLLLSLIKERLSGADGQQERDMFVSRVEAITRDLALPPHVSQGLSLALDQKIAALDPNQPSTRDALLAMGEIASA